MHRSVRALSLAQSLKSTTRGFCSASSNASNDKLVASVLFERLPVIIPKIDPAVYAFKEFSYRWNQRYQKEYPEKFLKKSESREADDYQMDYVPAPRITEADKANDTKYELFSDL